MGVLEGKVVLVTGGARGIGREIALLAAREGAKVVVNDLGGSGRGDDLGNADPAEEVVREIVEDGGLAVANSLDISERAHVDRMIEQALDTYGGIHAVINSAGILRDTMIHKMEDEDFDAVVKVHLRGAYNLTRATIERFREQADGAYVHFGSTSGLIGNLGQSNYAAAKMGVVGLSRIVAMEGERKNVRSNVVAPFAWTRLIATIPVTDEASAKRVQMMRDGMRADQVAQLAVALAAPTAKVSGQIIAARGNEVILFNQPRPVRSAARMDGWTPTSLIEQAFPYFEKDFTDLGATASNFPYDPV